MAIVFCDGESNRTDATCNFLVLLRKEVYQIKKLWIAENPYFQYLIGLPGYQTQAPFVPALLVEFRKRLTEGILGALAKQKYGLGLVASRLDETTRSSSSLSIIAAKIGSDY